MSEDPAWHNQDAPEGSAWDSQGIPDTADDADPERAEYPEPSLQPMPADRPQAVTDHGTTVQEQIEGESLDGRLAREEPEEFVDPEAPLDRDSSDTADTDLGTQDVDDVAGIVNSAEENLDAPLGGDEVGVMVPPDRGVREDTEKDEVAAGYERRHDMTAEEAAVHVVYEE